MNEKETLERMCQNWKRRYDDQMQVNLNLTVKIAELEKQQVEFKRAVWKDFEETSLERKLDSINLGIKKAAEFLDIINECNPNSIQSASVYADKIRNAFLPQTKSTDGESDESNY